MKCERPKESNDRETLLDKLRMNELDSHMIHQIFIKDSIIMIDKSEIIFYRTELRVLQSSMDNEEFLNVIAEKLAKLSVYEATNISKPKPITTIDVLNLVASTGGGYSKRECLIALNRANGDHKKAIEILRRLGQV